MAKETTPETQGIIDDLSKLVIISNRFGREVEVSLYKAKQMVQNDGATILRDVEAKKAK
jgi:hypothetical protein